MLAAKARGGGPRSGERNRLFLQRPQGVSQRRARSINPVNGWLNSKIRKIAHAADRANSERQVNTVTFQRREQAKACKDDYEPKRQNCQKRRRNKIVGFDKQQKAGLREVIAQLDVWKSEDTDYVGMGCLYEQPRYRDEACSSHLVRLLRRVPPPAPHRAFGAAQRIGETIRVRRQRRQASERQRRESRSAA